MFCGLWCWCWVSFAYWHLVLWVRVFFFPGFLSVIGSPLGLSGSVWGLGLGWDSGWDLGWDCTRGAWVWDFPTTERALSQTPFYL